MAISNVTTGALSMSFLVAPVTNGDELLFSALLAAYIAAGGRSSSPLALFLSATYADALAAGTAFAALAGTVHANAVGTDYIDCSFQTATGITLDQTADAGIIRIALAATIAS
jgi:hypothetical protein